MTLRLKFLLPIFTLAISTILFAQQKEKQQIIPLTVADSNGGNVERASVRVKNSSSPAWRITQANRDYYLKPNIGRWTNVNDALHLEINYFDLCYAKINVEVETNSGNVKPDRYTQIYMLNSGDPKTAYFKFSGVKSDEIKHIKLRLSNAKTPALAIASANASPTPFPNSYFNWLLEESWKRAYTGPVDPSLKKMNTTLKGKVMCGYQGWFATPNDALDRGWIHWGNVMNGQFSVDGWPYQQEYPSYILDKAGDTKTKSGKTAYLFSSARPEVVVTHFKWMKKYNIDGVFLQRFVGSTGYAYDGREEWVMGCVREAANRMGRIWAIEYDVSGGSATSNYVFSTGIDATGEIEYSLFEKISVDWKWLVNDFGVKQDASYAREGDKTVVFVWGMELRNLDIEECDRVMNFLKHDPKYGNNYFIGGISGGWMRKKDWHDHLSRHDALLIWQSGSYESDIRNFKQYFPGVEYYAHVHPGFSWANLKHIQSESYEAYTDRKDGAFYEGRITKAAEAGSKLLFVGMLDEYDEATQILPLHDDPPKPPRRPGAVVFFGEVKDGEHKPPFNHYPEVGLKFGTSPNRAVGATNFFMNWELSVQIPADGEYKFWVEGPEGDSYKFKSNNKEFINERNMGPGTEPRKATVTLKKGFMFPIKIEYNHATGGGEMKLMWEGPRIKAGQVPANVQFDAWGRFITNEGKSPFLYLEITGKAKDLLKKNL